MVRWKLISWLNLKVNQTEYRAFDEVMDYGNPLHLDMVDRYLQRIRDKTIPDEDPPSLESFYPYESQVSICYNCVVDYLPPTQTKRIFQLKNTTIPVKEVARSCVYQYGDANDGWFWCNMVYAIHQDSSPITTKIYQTELYKWRSTTSRFYGLFVEFI